MHPYVFNLVVLGYHIRPPSYGVLLAIAFSAAYFSSLRRAERLGENPQHIENLFLLVVFGSVVGSRLFHVLFEDLSYYTAHPLKVFAVWEGGYTFYGAVLASMLMIYIYCRVKKVSFLQFADVAGEAAALGLGIGRIGCFCAGCCWGRPTNLPWSVTFTNPDSFSALRGIPLHPTQLYESFGGFLIWGYLLWRFKRRAYEGQIFFHALALYSVLRFIIEIFRGDDYRGYVLGGLISYSQLVALAIFPFAIAGIIIYSRRARAAH